MHFLAWRRRSLKVYLGDAESKAYVLTLGTACVAVAAFLLYRDVFPDWATSFRYAVFNVVSVATTTGFASTDYNQWPTFAPILMLFLCGFATCAGSTGGGIKMIRGIILMKQAQRELNRIVHPRSMNPIVIGGQIIENKVIFAVLAFMLVYGAALTTLTFFMMLLGLDAITAFTAIVACLNNTGPGLNLVGPAANYGILAPLQIWTCTFAMLIGRLELFTVLILLTPLFWRR
jgi:trk system potassium uptake protein TrkH